MSLKLYYIVFYDGGVPFMSIPTYSRKINKKKLVKEYCLNSDVVIKIESEDKFIGW